MLNSSVRFGVACGVVVLLVARAAPAAADEEYGYEHPFAFSAHFGIRTPLGAGIAYEVAPVEWAALEAGVGIGSSGPQAALMARLRAPARSMAFIFGFGYSRGPYEVGNHDCFPILSGCASVGSGTQYVWRDALWRNVEIGFERRTTSGSTWRMFFGFARVLNVDSAVCEPPPAGRVHCADGAVTAYIGTAFGQAFSP